MQAAYLKCQQQFQANKKIIETGHRNVELRWPSCSPVVIIDSNYERWLLLNWLFCCIDGCNSTLRKKRSTSKVFNEIL